MRKIKDISSEEKANIIEYAKINGIYPTYNKYRAEGIKIYPDTIKYWLDPSQREKVKAASNSTHQANKENQEYKTKRAEYQEQLRVTDEYVQKRKIWYDKTKAVRSKAISDKSKANYDSVKELLREQHKKWVQSTTVEQRREYRLKYYTPAKQLLYNEKVKRKYHTEPLFKLKMGIRNNINRALSNNFMTKNHPSIVYLGCSLQEFQAYIEDQFEPGMTWENNTRGENGWHLDHITPLATLKNIDDQEQLKKICHYTNYQPLWECDNLSKGDSISHTPGL